MDPFIEAAGIWSTFHHAFLTACHDQLNERLPESYVATLGERVQLVDEDELGVTSRITLPDVAVVRTSPAPRSAKPESSASATLEPSTLPQASEWLDEPKQIFVQVVHVPERRVVTDIELLFPSNKRHGSEDRAAYLGKRKSLLRHEVNLVELDLLLGGERLRMLAPLPVGDYFAFVTRWQTARECDVYAWTIRSPLPTIPVPLKAEDGAVALDLAAAFGRTYEAGRYQRVLRYSGELATGLSEADRQWAVSQARNG